MYEICDGIFQCEQAFSCMRLVMGLLSVDRFLTLQYLLHDC